jgi:transketolase
MEVNPDIWALTGDLGYGGFDQIQEKFPDRFINTGASEQSMINIAVGLALQGKIPYVYSITSFLLYRPYEAIRNYINHEKIPVKLVGSGRDKDYAHDGFSHWSADAKSVLDNLPNIIQYWPKKETEIIGIIKDTAINKKPCFISLIR